MNNELEDDSERSISQQLKRLREQAGMSVRQLAKELDLSASSYAYYESSYKKPTLPMSLARQLAQILTPHGVKRDDIMALAGVLSDAVMGDERLSVPADLPDLPPTQAEYVPIPFLEVKAGMGAGQLPEEVMGATRLFEASLIRSLRAHPDQLISMDLDGQSMEPLLFSGDQILINRAKANISEPGIFVLFDGDGVVCKWVERVHGSSPPRLRIFSENKRFHEYQILAEEAVIYGRVVWFARRM